MKKMQMNEALGLTSELTNVYIQYKNEYKLSGNTSSQFMARTCCIIIGNMVEKREEVLKEHLEHCLTAISCKNEFKSPYNEGSTYLALYDGEIPYILAELEKAYDRIPEVTKTLDSQHNNRQALWGFLDAVHRTLQGCNNQEYFDKPDFMNFNPALAD
ncbi:hypothetical protein ACPV5T_04615 [Vibrio astriarenae]